MPLGIDYMNGNSRIRDLGTLDNAPGEDVVRNPYYLDLMNQNNQARALKANADMLEDQAAPDREDRERTQKTYDQQQADYDLEYNAPRRQRLEDDIAGASEERQAEDYFNPWTSQRRQDEQQFKRDLSYNQYGRSADAREYAADRGYQGKIGAAQIEGGARRDVGRASAGARARGQMVDPGTGQPFAGQESNVNSIDQMITGRGRNPFPRERLQEYANRYTRGDLRAAEEDLANQDYYIDDGQ